MSSEMNSGQQSSQGVAEAQPDFEHSYDGREAGSLNFFGRVVKNDSQREIRIHTESNLNGIEQELALLRHKLRKSGRKIIEVIRQKENLAGSYESQAAYLAEVASRLEELEKQKAQADEQIQKLTARQAFVSDRKETVEQLNNELETARIKIGRLEDTIREKEGQYQHILEKLQQIETQHHDTQQTRQGIEQQNQDMQSRIADLQSRLELTGREKDSLQAGAAVLEDMEEKYRASHNEIEALQVKIEDLQSLLESKSQELADTNNRLRAGQDNRQSMEEKLRQYTAHIEQLNQKECALRQQLEALSHTIEQAQEVNRLLQQELGRKVSGYEKELDGYKNENQSLRASLQDESRENESLCKQASILKGYENQYHAAREANQTLQAGLEDMQSRLTLKNKELEDAYVGWQQTRSEQQGLEKELAEKNLSLSRLEQSRNDLQQQMETVAQLKEQAENRCRALQNEFDKSESEYRQETSEREKEILSLRLCVQKAIKQEESLQARIEQMEETETKYQQILAEHQSLRAEMDRLQEELSCERKQLEQAKYEWKESQQRRLSLEEELTTEKANTRQLREEQELLRGQLGSKDLAIEQAQNTNRQLHQKLEKKQEQFEKDLATREQEIQSLWTRLCETSNIVREFEDRFRQIKAENTQLRDSLEQAGDRAVGVQGRISEQNLENASLQKKISELQHSLTLCSGNGDDRAESELRVRLLEENLAQKAADMEATQKELREHQAMVKELREKFSLQSEQTGQVQQPQQPPQQSQGICTDEPQYPQGEEFQQGHNVNGDPLKRKLYEATSRIQTLRLQLQDRAESLKKAHQTIQLLREQKSR